MKKFYKVYYTTNTCDGEFVVKGKNSQEEFERLDDAVKVMEEDKKEVDKFNKKVGLEIKHNYKIYSYTRELEMYWNVNE